MAKAAPASKWTEQHESALSGLAGLGFPKKYVRGLLEQLEPQKDLNTLINVALKAHGNSMKGQAPPNAPENAVPLAMPAQNAPSAGPGGPPPAAPPRPSGPQWHEQYYWRRPPNAPSAKGPPPPAPIIPAAAAPSSPSAAAAQTGPAQKPRIRVRAAGQRVGPAPLGGPAQQAAPQAAPAPAATKAGPVRIRTEEELERLPVGTEFIWPDGHIYRKDQ